MSNRFDRIVDHGATDVTVDRDVIATQLATAAALRERLDDYGGVILGDEVGAGKTYVTFALLAEALANNPRKGAVIFVPSQLLKTKWCDQLQDYLRSAVRDPKLAERLIARITPVDRSLRDDGSFDATHWGRAPARNAIVIATHNVYSYRTSRADQAACLRAAAAAIDVGRNIRPRALLRACDVDPDTPPEWADWARPDVLRPRTLVPLRELLERYASGERGLGAASRDAVQDVRRHVGQGRLPDAALVVIDEAHNLKSTHSAIYQALMSVLSSRFDALLFLTATPFQLGRDELLNIVDFFRFARAYEGREQDFVRRVDSMRHAMDEWVNALDAFGAAWRDLDASQASHCIALIANGAAVADSGAGNLAQRAADAFARCITAKRRLEAGMRPFVVRSVRERDHHEHGPVDDQYLSEETRIPLALVDRLLVELMRSGRTFISSALISACSSWEALLAAAIMREEQRESHTRPVLRTLADLNLLGSHPKVAQTVAECLAGLESGEKTLVFVEREQTGRMLRDALNEKIDDAGLDGTEAPSNAALRQRLQDRARFGWPSLRENYLHTVYPLVFHRVPDRSEVAAAWAGPETRELWSRVDPAGEKRNYVIEKRFWEHALFARACARTSTWWEGLSDRLRASVENLLQPEYVLNGLDLRSGATGECLPVPTAPQRTDFREPRFPFAEAFVAYRSPWVVGSSALATLRPEDRADFVDAAANAVASSHFRQELAALEIESDPAAHFEAIGSLLLDPTGLWPRRFALLSDQARDAVRATNDKLADARMFALIEALGSNVRVQYIDGSTKQQTQQNAVDGFNTPLYPEVIVTTAVLAEGLDLHRFCRRVIHHDLPWNPAKLEQRTGRVDRVGSLSELLRREHPGGDFRIDVWLPYVPGTYDEFIYERVTARRREFRCILGNKPEWRDELLGEDEEGIPIDDSLVKRLQVNLGPA
jgi:superfamily II DNA or RNA helicase